MSWNYRIMRNTEAKNCWPDQKCVYGIHEVYYNKKGEVDGWTKDPICGYSDSLEDLKDKLQKMLGAFDKSVLEDAED